jgi:hypothetical protein
LIERQIARASNLARVEDWRVDAFGLVAPPGTPMPPIAAMALRGALAGAAALGTSAGADKDAGAWVCVATPVHLSAGMTQVTFPTDGVVQLQPAEAAALAADFNTVFEGAGVRLAAGLAGALLCVFDRALEVVTHDPEAAVGQDVFGFQPSGSDASRLRRLASEIEMWLFDHAVNRRRTERGLLAITGLWFWGGGPAAAKDLALPIWAAGQDIFFAAFGDAVELGGESGSGVVVVNECPGSATWPEVERRWLRPGVAALRAGRLGQIHVSAGHRRFTITRGLPLRFWRRARPWWNSFETRDGGTRDGGLDGD